MRSGVILGVCCWLIVGGAAPVHGAETAVLDDGRITLNGEPVFLIGLYELPEEDAALQDAVDAGFNLFRAARDEDSLDRIQEAGAYAWLAFGWELSVEGEEAEARREGIREVAERFRDHPALAVWEAPDEALWNAWYASRLQYFRGGDDFRAMEEAANELPEAERAAVDAAIERARDALARALWAEFDELRAAAWEQIGQEPPHPDLTLADAADDARRLGDGLSEGIEALKEADPDRIFWYNHAPRNSIAAMRHHNRNVDMAGCDIYPVPQAYPQEHSDLRDQTLASVGAYTRRMCDAAPGKAVAMVLQGFGWADIQPHVERRAEETGLDFGRRPRFDETRFMAYSAIVNGANAVLYWGTQFIEKDSALWNDLLTLAHELDALQPFLSAADAESQPVSVAHDGPGSVDEDDGPLLLLKESGGEYVLIAVNEQLSGVAFDVTGLPAALEGRTLQRLAVDESVTVQNGSFSDGIRRHGVHVYATTDIPIRPDASTAGEE